MKNDMGQDTHESVIRIDYRMLMETAALAGEIMLENGAEAYRVEDTISRMLYTAASISHAETVVLSTSFVVTAAAVGMDPVTAARRIKSKGTNLNKICRVNQVSRDYCEGKISLEEVWLSLQKIRREKLYSGKLNFLCMIIIASSFTALLGGTAVDAAAAGFCGAVLELCLRAGRRTLLHSFIVEMCAAMVSSAAAIGFFHFLPAVRDADIIIIGTMMPLVPGVAVTNAARDTLQGDFVSGCARILEAFVKAFSAALGVGIVIFLYRALSGGGL